MAINDGGPAFPTPVIDQRGARDYPGMSLRDWFAGQAMAGMLAYSQNDRSGNWANNASEIAVARGAYEYADAMLAAREQTTTRKE